MNLLGIDVGGTAVKLGWVSLEGTLLARDEHPVDFDGYQTPILDTMLGATAQFCAATATLPDAIGISATGQIDEDAGYVAGSCGNLPGWVGTQLRAAFAAAYAVPVTVMNDANCALLGEQWVGAATGARDVVLVTLGTGVGGGLLAGGRVIRGARGFGGELGHMITHFGGRPCTCGLRGCWEQYASVTALLRDAGRAMDPAPADGRAFFRAVAAGDEKAMAVCSRWIDEIAVGLCGLTHLTNPERIIIGGGVSVQEQLLIGPLRERVLAQVMPRYKDGTRLLAAALGNDAGLIGAARMAAGMQDL